MQICVIDDAKLHVEKSTPASNSLLDSDGSMQICVSGDAKSHVEVPNHDSGMQICAKGNAKSHVMDSNFEEYSVDEEKSEVKICVNGDAKSQFEIPNPLIGMEICAKGNAKSHLADCKFETEEFLLDDHSVGVERIRGGVRNDSDSDSFGSDMIMEAAQLIAEQMRNLHGGHDAARIIRGGRSNQIALNVLGSSVISSIVQRNQELEDISRQRLAAFHPAIEDISAEFGDVTEPLTLEDIDPEVTVRSQMDTDSIYSASTRSDEIIDMAVVPRNSMVNFRSITDRTKANTTTRFAFAGDDDTILVRVRGRKPEFINGDRCPNLQVAHVDSPKPGVGSYIHLYYLGMNYLTTTVPLSRILAKRLVGKVFIPIDFIEANAQIKAKLLEFALPPAPPAEVDSDGEPVDEFQQEPTVCPGLLCIL